MAKIRFGGDGADHVYDCGSFTLYYVTAEDVVCTPICHVVTPLWLLPRYKGRHCSLWERDSCHGWWDQPPTSAGVLIGLAVYLTVSVARYRVGKLGDQDEGKLLAFLQSMWMQGREGGYFQADLPRTITVRCIRAVDLPRWGRLHKRP
jgi:hypothetical protein